MNKDILIIEDEQTVRESLAELLELYGYQIRIAVNGSDGVKKVEEKSPDLIICDVMMPVMDGIEFSMRIKSKAETVNIPIIFLTAKTEEDDIRAGMNTGADDYLKKPIKAAELLQAIEARLKLRDLQEQSEMNRKLCDKDSLSDEDLKKLTKSEQRIIKMIAEGKASQEIADILFISPKTVEVHRYNITKKLKLYGNNALMRFVLKSSTK